MLFAFAIGTGLRQGELYSLELRDVHLDDEHPHIVVRYGKPRQGKTKTGKIRRVELFGRALQAARAWLVELPQWAKANPQRLMWPTQRGCRRRDSKPPRGWSAPTRADGKSYLELAGLHRPVARHDGRPVRFHDLRHTCGASLVSGWWGRRWSLIEVRDHLGHDDIDTTQRYAHLAPGVLAEAARQTGGRPSPRRWPNLPQTFHRPSGAVAKSSMISPARHRGFEPLAFGSGVTPVGAI
jgi:integrase